MQKTNFSIILIVIALLAAGCNRSAVTTLPADLASIVTPAGVTDVPADRLTSNPGPTASLVRQPTQASTATNAASLPTATSSALPDFKQAQVAQIGYFQGEAFLVILQVPGGVWGEYRPQIDGQAGECIIQDGIPDRLFCSFPPQAAGKTVLFSLLPISGGNAIFEKSLVVPAGAAEDNSNAGQPTNTP
jgi:hypothetical protein